MKKTSTFLRMLLAACFLTGTAGLYAQDATPKLMMTYETVQTAGGPLEEIVEEHVDEWSYGKSLPINPGFKPGDIVATQLGIPYGTTHSNDFMFSFENLPAGAAVTYGMNPDKAKAPDAFPAAFDTEADEMGFGNYTANDDGTLVIESTVSILEDYPTKGLKEDSPYKLYARFEVTLADGNPIKYDVVYIFRAADLPKPAVLFEAQEGIVMPSLDWDADREQAQKYGLYVSDSPSEATWINLGEIEYGSDQPANGNEFNVAFELNQDEDMVIQIVDEMGMFKKNALFQIASDNEDVEINKDSTLLTFPAGMTEASFKILMKKEYDMAMVTPDNYNIVCFRYGTATQAENIYELKHLRVVFIPVLPEDYYSFSLTGLKQDAEDENAYTAEYGEVKENRIGGSPKVFNLTATQVAGENLTFTSDKGTASVFMIDTTDQRTPEAVSTQAGTWTIKLAQGTYSGRGTVAIENAKLVINPAAIKEEQWGTEITETWTLKSDNGSSSDEWYVDKTVKMTVTPQRSIKVTVTSEDARYTDSKTSRMDTLQFGDVNYGETPVEAVYTVEAKYMAAGDVLGLELTENAFAFTTTVKIGDSEAEVLDRNFNYTAPAAGDVKAVITVKVKEDYSMLQMLSYPNDYFATLVVKAGDTQDLVEMGLNMVLPEETKKLFLTNRRDAELAFNQESNSYLLDDSIKLSTIDYDLDMRVNMFFAGYKSVPVTLVAPDNALFTIQSDKFLAAESETGKFAYTTPDEMKDNAMFQFIPVDTKNFEVGQTYTEAWTVEVGAEDTKATYTLNVSLEIQPEPVVTITSESQYFTFTPAESEWDSDKYRINFGEVEYGQVPEVSVKFEGKFLPKGAEFYIYSMSGESSAYTDEVPGMEKSEYKPYWGEPYPAWKLVAGEDGTFSEEWVVSVKADYDYERVQMEMVSGVYEFSYELLSASSELNFYNTMYVEFVPKKGGSGTGLAENAIDGVYFDGRVVVNPQGIALSVYNTVGQLVASGAENIDLTACPNGVYVIKAAKGNMKIVK